MSSPEITNKKGMPLGRFLRFEAKKNPPKLYLFRWDYVSKTTKVDTMKRGREGVLIFEFRTLDFVHLLNFIIIMLVMFPT